MIRVVPIGAERPVSGPVPDRAGVEPVATGATTGKQPGGASVTALVPVTAVQPLEEDYRRPARRSATFIAQLIANDQQLPQTRERRRAEPQEAHAAYGAAARLTRRR